MACDNPNWRDGPERWGRHSADKWPEGFPKPRTCDYCGGVNPEDLLKLVELGWEMEPSTKFYKSYWHPPGHLDHFNAVMADLPGYMEGRRDVTRKHEDPVPPVKLYSDHLSIEMADRINDVLRKNREVKNGLEKSGK